MKLSPTFRRDFAKAHAPMVEAMTDEAMFTLEANLGRTTGGTRSGAEIPGEAFRRSARGEMPQEVTGELRSGVYRKGVRGTTGEVGIEDDAGKLDRLEHAPMSKGGRAPVETTMRDERLHARMAQVAERAAKGQY